MELPMRRIPRGQVLFTNINLCLNSKPCAAWYWLSGENFNRISRQGLRYWPRLKQSGAKPLALPASPKVFRECPWPNPWCLVGPCQHSKAFYDHWWSFLSSSLKYSWTFRSMAFVYQHTYDFLCFLARVLEILIFNVVGGRVSWIEHFQNWMMSIRQDLWLKYDSCIQESVCMTRKSGR